LVKQQNNKTSMMQKEMRNSKTDFKINKENKQVSATDFKVG
jgi:hypothetical protein